jgi:hypothetical protein
MPAAALAVLMFAACFAGCNTRGRDAETDPNRPRTGELHFDADSARSDAHQSTTQE